MKHHLRLLLAAGFGAISIGASAAAVHDWTVTRVAEGEYGGLFLADMNNAGQVTGSFSFKLDGIGRSFLYSPGNAGQFVDIGGLGGNDTKVAALNASGQLTGYSLTADVQQLPFVYRNGRMEPLVPPGGLGLGGSGIGINNRGEVLINWISEDSVRHGTVVNPAGLFTVLNAPGRQVIPKGINNRGQIFGDLATPASGDNLTSLHGFLYDKGQITDFGTLGGSYTQVSDMNEGGQIVGSSAGADFIQRPFLYSDGRMMELAGFPFGGGARDINDRGQIIGNIQLESPFGGNVHGFLHSDGRFIDLGGNSPLAINELGQIVGIITGSNEFFFYSDGKVTNLTEWLRARFSDVAGTSNAMLNDLGQIVLLADLPAERSAILVLTPIPEPSTYALMLSGLGVLAWIARRKRGRAIGNRADQTHRTGLAP